MHEMLGDALRQRAQPLREQRQFGHLRGGQVGFGQMHHGILGRAAQRGSSRSDSRFVQTVGPLEAGLDGFRRAQHELARPGVARAPEIRGAGEHDEGVGIEILGLVNGRACASTL